MTGPISQTGCMDVRVAPRRSSRSLSPKKLVKRALFAACYRLDELSLWIQRRILRTTLEQKRASDNSAIPPAQMDRDLLSLHIRWAGHSVEKGVRCRKVEGRGHGRPAQLRAALEEWHRRGYPARPFIRWAEANLEDYERWNATGEPQFQSEKDLPVFRPDSPVVDLLTHRVSIRRWKPEPVAEETLRRVLEIATCAPTSCNRQTWKLYVEPNRDLAAAANLVGTANPTLRALAPVTIYIAIDSRLYPERWAPAQDAGIMALQLSLAATSLGLGGCLMYAGENFPQEEFRRRHNAPPWHYVHVLYLFGQPAERTESDKRAVADDVAIFL